MTQKLIDAPHRDVFLSNEKEVLRLLEIHGEITSKGPGYKHNVEVLNKSALILLVATWESYIEELATNSFDFLLENCPDPKDIPNAVKTLSTSNIKNSENPLQVWGLAGDGWRAILRQHKATAIKKYVTKLNTPKTENIDDIINSLIGLKNVSSYWLWKGMSNKGAKKKLEDLINVRGEIAHKVATTTSVTKSQVVAHAQFLRRLATITHNRCTAHLESVCGSKPWKTYHYGKTR